MRPVPQAPPALLRSIRWLRWYLREVSGESAYDRYVAHARAEHQDVPLLSRREFERRRMDQRDGRPESRCC
jgi:uncharacterized short protein YbdD (DUF466 family)